MTSNDGGTGGRSGLVLPVRLDPTGSRGPTPKAARGPKWRRTSHGFYVPSSVDRDVPEQRIVEASVVLPAIGGITGWAALRWSGARWLTGRGPDGVASEPVTLAVSYADVRPQPGIAVSHEHLRFAEVDAVHGLPLTNPARSVLFEMRHAHSIEAAVVVADMAMQGDVVTTEELVAYAGTLGTWTGIPQARTALPLVRENSWSPQETRLRLLWTLLAGFPEPLCNQPVFDLAGHHIGTPDLLDPIAGVAGEYEGVVHLDRHQRGVDVRREQALREVGLELFPVVGSDWRDETRIVERIRSAYARAMTRPVADRGWTVALPAWWTPTDTVARRRALSERERRSWLPGYAG